MLSKAPAILVVEDEDEIRDAISELLIDTGFRVSTAATAAEAIALTNEQEFDLVVADIRLPGEFDGLAMARRIRMRHPSIKCLFISGKQDPIVCDPVLDEFISKPFRSSELLGCVWKVLRGNLPNPRLEIAN